MKKRFTLLSVLTIATSLSFAQNLPTLSTIEKSPAKISLNRATESNELISPKVGGDLLWGTDFSAGSPAWTTGNIAPGVQGEWLIGAFPSSLTGYTGAFGGSSGNVATFNGVQYLINGTVALQDAYMLSETIDLSGAPLVSISWNQVYRRFNYDKTFVEVSTDDGATWTAYQVNTNAVPNADGISSKVSLDIPTASSATCKIRFRWQSLNAGANVGSGYAWAIDNVEIREGYLNNVSLLSLYGVVGQDELTFTKMPKAQAASAGNMSFGARAKNTGIDAQDVTLKMTSGSYTQSSSPVTTITSLNVDTLSILEMSGFPIPSNVGTTTVTGTLTSNNVLGSTSDDAASLKMEITNNVYAKDAYDGTAASMTSDFRGFTVTEGDTEIGTYFEIFEDAQVVAVQIGIPLVSAADKVKMTGNYIVGKIYESTPTSLDLVETTLEIDITNASFGTLVSGNLVTPYMLEAGKTYLVTASYPDGVDAMVAIGMSGFTIYKSVLGSNGESDFGWMRADDEENSLVSCPVVRLKFNEFLGVNEIAAQYDLNVYPNPFTSNTEVAFELKNDANVSINVTDITGRTVSTVNSQMYTSGAHTVSVDGTNLNAGIYNCTITIGNNVITKRIVKN